MKRIFAGIIFLLLSSMLFSSNLKEKGRYFVKNYAPKEYQSHAQIWNIAQDSRGFVYFGNGDGVMEYDGMKWRKIILPSKTTVRSVVIDSNERIYIGSVGEIGYLDTDDNGSTIYISLQDKIQSKDKVFRDVYEIKLTSDCVYFRAYDKLLRLKNDSIISWNPKNRFTGTIIHENEFYVLDKNYGFYKVVGDSLVLFDDLNGNNKIDFRAHVRKTDGTYLLYTRLSGLLSYDFRLVQDGNTGYLGIVKSEVNDFINEFGGYKGEFIDKDNILISTITNGFVHSNEEGEIFEFLNKSRGIKDDVVFSYELDKDSNLWLGTNNGISYLEVSSPITYWNFFDKLEGMLHDVERFNGVIYVASFQGFYYIVNNKVTRIPGNYGSCWSLKKFKLLDGTTKLLGASVGKVFEIENFELKPIKELQAAVAAYRLTQSRTNPNRLFISLSDGITSLLYENGEWIDEGLLMGVYDDIRSVCEDKNGYLWLSTFRNGYIRLKLAKDSNQPIEVIRYKEDKGVKSLKNVHCYPYKDNIVFCTEAGLLRYDAEKDYFFPDSLFWPHLIDGSQDIFDFHEGPDNTIWITGLNHKEGNIGYGKIIDGQRGEWHYKAFNRIPEMMVLDIYVEKSGIAWIAGTEGLFRYDSNDKDFNKSFDAIIRTVKIDKDSVLFNGSYYNEVGDRRIAHNKQGDKNFSLDFKYNSIIFEYTSNNYEGQKEQLFKYCLRGYDTEFSNWTTKKFKEYTNLPEGVYTFDVIAKNIYDTESEIDTFTFTINPPIYRTIFAYIIYIFSIIIIIRVLIIFYTRRLKKANLKLEELVLARTAEIENQKEEIKSQAEKLVLTNIELEKLSIVARETNNAIMIMDAQGNIEWVNDGFTRLYGFTIDELKKTLGNNITEGSGLADVKEIIQSCIETKKPVIYECKNITKDKKEVWAQTTLTPIVDSDGNVEKLIAIDSDINKLKEAEQLIDEQRKEIEVQRDVAVQQRDEIAIQKDEIIDSMVYARRIQNAILPGKDHLDNIFEDYFIFYLPRDIVSGDFYWAEKIDEKIVVAAVDCTGHGVPGAFMSMLGVAFLNEIVLKDNVLEPHIILNKLRDYIIESLHQTGKEHEARDGMDISLCIIDLDKNIINYAGANNPIYIIRNSEIIEVPADKMPIGIHSGITKSFEKQTHDIQKGDMLYLFTDGFADQFGGEKGKKLKYAEFKKIILETKNEPLSDQNKAFDKLFRNWKGNYEQVDDVLVMGIRL